MKIPEFLKVKLTDDLKWKILVAIIIPFALNQCNTNSKIEDAQIQAKSAAEMTEFHAQQLDEVRDQNRDILSLVQDLAQKKEVSKERISKVNDLYNSHSDSVHANIARRKRIIDELFNKTFNKTSNEKSTN